MTLAELHYLVALHQEQHFGRAASMCGVSQPALSNAIQNLESELEVILFERSRSGVRPTDVGRQVIDQARRVLASASAIKDLASAGDNHLNTPIAVGTHSTIGPYLFLRCAVQLEKENCPLKLRTEEGDSKYLIDRLTQGYLDAAVITQQIQTADILVQQLFSEPFVVVMPKQHKLSRFSTLRPDQIQDESLHPPPYENGLRHKIREVLPALKEELDITFCKTRDADHCSPEMVRAVLHTFSGIAIMPLVTAQIICTEPARLTFRGFSDQTICRPVYLAWRASYPRHRAIDVLRRIILASRPYIDAHMTNFRSDRKGLLVDNKFW